MEKGRVVPLLYNLEPVQSDIIRTDKKKKESQIPYLSNNQPGSHITN